jgi:hypothetical protein
MKEYRSGTWILAAGLLPILGGCTEHSQYRGVQNNLDKALYYYEVDRQNQSHAISDEGGNVKDRLPTRVPSPALVDIDSQIQVLVTKAPLTSEPNLALRSRSADALLERKKRILQALESLDRYVTARTEAVQGYGLRGSGSRTEKADEAAHLFFKQLGELWPTDAPERPLLEKMVLKRKSDPEFKALHAFLQEQINLIETGDRALADDLRQKKQSLRLEAQVMGRGADPVFIHMEGYDTSEDGRLQARDRWGLNLSAEDKTHLQQQMKATQDIAASLEALRKKQASFQETVVKLGGSICTEELGDDLPKIEKWIAAYSPAEIQKQLAEMAKLFQTLIDKVKAGSLPDKVKSQLTGLPQQFDAWVKKDGFGTIGELWGIIGQVQELCKGWSRPKPEDPTALLLDTTTLLGRLRTLLADPQLLKDLNVAVTGFLQAQADVLSGQLEAVRLEIVKSSEFQELQTRLTKIATDFQEMRKLAGAIATKLGVFQAAAESAQVTFSSALDVPTENLRDTSIDLRRVHLTTGDEIVLRATLKEGGKEVDSTTATFRVSHLGWHAELSPAVVLVKPAELAGGEDDFRFAPALSWLHHYEPRPEETQWYMGPLRVLDPAIGIHAIFLAFDTPREDESIQIGLGGTLSFWKNRLEFGAGYNLMANANDEGRYYFFVGTDLIGLLQMVAGDRAR